MQYELDFYNFEKILLKNNISLEKSRKEIIFAGGPCVNTNTKPMENYIDFFILGNVENVISSVLELYTNNKDEFLKNISKIKGVYIPGLNKKIDNFDIDLDKIEYPILQPFPDRITEEFVFGRVFMLEIERGCPFACKFCLMKKFYDKVHYRSLDNIKQIIDQGVKINKVNKIIIYSPSFTHPKRKEILKYILSKGLEFSVPSLKVEYVDKELLELIKNGGQKTLTVAPECNELLRKSIGKDISDEIFFKFIDYANFYNFKKIKYYMMIGLPEQTEKDLGELVDFIELSKKRFKGELYVSINPFVPKPGMQFENHIFDKKLIKKQLMFLKKHLKVKFKVANINLSHKEWLLANSSDFRQI